MDQNFKKMKLLLLKRLNVSTVPCQWKQNIPFQPITQINEGLYFHTICRSRALPIVTPWGYNCNRIHMTSSVMQYLVIDIKWPLGSVLSGLLIIFRENIFPSLNI